MRESRGHEGAPAASADLGPVRRSIWRYLAGIELLHLLVGVLGFAGGARFFYLGAALPWTLVVGLVLSRRADLLYTAEGRQLLRLHLATRVTLIRVLAIPLVLTFIHTGQLRAAALAFLGAALTDWLDGFLARRMNEVTQLGRMVDPTIDAVFCFATMVALVLAPEPLRGYLPWWILALTLLRYAVLVGGALTLKALLGKLPVRATFLGRLFYFLQYGLLVLFLLDHERGSAWGLPWMLGAIQLLVTVQLLALGRSLYSEEAA